MTKRRAAFGLAGIFLLGTLAGAGCGQKKDAAGGGKQGRGAGGPNALTPVEVTNVTTGTIAKTVPVTGNIQALQDVQLSARAAGRVLAVNFREGQVVRAGQIVVQQDTTDLEANVRQAQAGIQSAQANVRQAQANAAQAQANVSSNQAKLSQARTNYTLQVQTAKQAVAQARAQVANAKQNYLKVKGGSRPQQILQGQSQVALAKANLDNAQTILTRNKSLFTQGAIAKADLDTAQTNYDVQVETYKNAQQALSLTQEGAQTEDIAAAQALLQQQQANLNTAIANQQQIQVRQQDVLAAQDAVRQAKAAVQQQHAAIQQAQAAVRTAQATLAFNQQQVANAFIRSPIDGIVAAREVEPGQVASPGTNLMRIVGLGSVYYEPTISETDFAQTTVGDPVQVQVDALPGRTFDGVVRAVYPTASSGSRQFTLHVSVPNPTHELRPGMFARGILMEEVHRNSIVIPVSALVPIQSTAPDVVTSEGTATGGTTLPPQQVFLVGRGGKVVARPVKTGIVTHSQVEVTSGLKPGDPLITVGQGQLLPGQRVKIESAANGVGAGLATL